MGQEDLVGRSGHGNDDARLDARIRRKFAAQAPGTVFFAVEFRGRAATTTESVTQLPVEQLRRYPTEAELIVAERAVE